MSTILDIKGRTALVTGAGQGVGRQVALYLAEHGAGAVVINDFHADRAESVAAEVEAAGAKALPIAFDVSNFEAVGAAGHCLASCDFHLKSPCRLYHAPVDPGSR